MLEVFIYINIGLCSTRVYLTIMKEETSMKKNNLFKMLTLVVLLVLALSLSACSDDAEGEVLEPDEGSGVVETPVDPDQTDIGNDTDSSDMVHVSFELVYEEADLAGYVTDLTYEELYDYYKVNPMLNNTPEFEALPDAFMFTTDLWDFVMDIGVHTGGTDEQIAWEKEFLNTYEEVDGYLVVFGARGGSEMGIEMIPDVFVEHYPDTGAFVYIGRMETPPDIGN